jgi:hypothetical protein
MLRNRALRSASIVNRQILELRVCLHHLQTLLCVRFIETPFQNTRPAQGVISAHAPISRSARKGTVCVRFNFQNTERVGPISFAIPVSCELEYSFCVPIETQDPAQTETALSDEHFALPFVSRTLIEQDISGTASDFGADPEPSVCDNILFDRNPRKNSDPFHLSFGA